MTGKHKSFFSGNISSVKRRRFALSLCGAVGVGAFVYRRKKMSLLDCSDFRKAANQCLSLVNSDLVSGGIAYLAQVVLLYPVDTLKIKCQTDGSSIWRCLHKTCASGKISSLFSGIGPTAVCSCIVGGVFLASYTWGKTLAKDVIKYHVPRMRDELSHAVELFGSLFSWGITSLVDAPVELLKHQTQAGVLKSGMWKGIVSCFREGKIASLYCCLIPYMIKSLPFDVTELMAYGELSSARKSSSLLALIPEPLWGMFTGVVAGSAAVVLSMPMDCIKTKMEIQSASGKSHKRFFACGISMVRKEGLGSLFRGIVPRLVVHVPGSMVYWMVVDMLQQVRVTNQRCI